MGIFDRFRSTSTQAPANDAPVETVESMRKRAVQRLMGSVVLVLLGVGGFALLLDRQPRPVAVDIPIDIPDKKTVKPLELPAVTKPGPSVGTPVTAPTPSSPAPKPIAASVGADASLAPGEKIVPPAAAVPTKPSTQAVPVVAPIAAAVKPEPAKPQAPKPESAPPPVAAVPAPEPKPAAPKPAAAAQIAANAEAARAKALLEGGTAPKAAPPAAEGERFIVQFGSFSQSASAQAARNQVEKAGLKTYSQEAQTADGKRIRTRVGPFATRADAEKAAQKIKAMGLPANILTL